MRVMNDLDVVESNGRSRDQLEDLPVVTVRSHSADHELVVVQIMNQTVTLRAEQLLFAVRNSVNVAP